MSKAPGFFDEERETMPLAALRALQARKLRRSVAFAAERSAFYRKRKGLSPKIAHFSSLKEFAAAVPFTSKADLRESGMYENLCVPRTEIAEVHFSSGTSGRPVPSFLTQKDIKEGGRYLARTWYMQGVRRQSVFAMFASYGLFSAGLINHYALQEIGAFIIPAGNGSALKMLQLMRDFDADACAAVASYYPYLIAAAGAEGFDLKSLSLKHLVAGGEPFSGEARRFIEEAFGATLYNQYGLCEINTGLAGECARQEGLHILADYAYPEIVDPETGATLPEGAEGELVLTTFHKEASPLIRYRTGDITRLTSAPCACGRTMPRIAPVERRAVETLFYKGMKIEKPAIAQAMEELKRHANPYLWQLEARAAAGREELVLRIASLGEESSHDHVAAHIRQHLNLKVAVIPFASEELAGIASGKLKHFIDNRRRS